MTFCPPNNRTFSHYPPAYSGPLDEGTTKILKESGLCLNHGLAYIDADISHLTDALRQLTENRRLLHDLRRGCRAALYSISILPLEISTDILCYAASDPINICNTKHPAWAISKVCRLWRTIITTVCPEVWARMLVPPVNYSTGVITLKDDALSSALGTVLSPSRTHLGRWEKLHLSIPPSAANVLRDLRGRLSSLRECVLHFYENEGGRNSLIDAFEYTPELMHMDLRGVNTDTLTPSIAPKLKTFKYRADSSESSHDGEWWYDPPFISVEYFLNIICNSPELAAVDILYEPWSSTHAVSPRIMRPLLSKLVINNTAFLRSLLAPALKEVTLAEDSNPELSPRLGKEDFLADFHELLVESRCSTLSRLDMTIDKLDHHFLSILQLIPALISFRLKANGAWRNDAVMQELIVQLTDAGEFLPRLEEIDLNLSTGAEWEIHCADCAMVNMVAARRHHSLQKFTFVAEDAILPNLRDEDVKRLEDFRADGLDVTLRSLDNLIPPYVRPSWTALRTPSPPS
ncbi:hypothetical protein F5146DRAFT_1135780 [Armillaria mellea]|nr:hypothetical protein F5146DRAFT_1135780 [Armillaria mellea]